MFKTIGIVRYWIYELDGAGLIAHWVVKLVMGMQFAAIGQRKWTKLIVCEDRLCKCSTL